jgi:hypothetical protein
VVEVSYVHTLWGFPVETFGGQDSCQHTDRGDFCTMTENYADGRSVNYGSYDHKTITVFAVITMQH